jgi:D-amino peptidase
MRVFLMTDMEGVAGVLNSEDWCYQRSRHYEAGCRLLTSETNAVVSGLLAGGAEAVVVVDGHGQGGIDPELLHPAAELVRGPVPGPYPFAVEDCDTIAWVGQHAKAGTERAHLPHTQSFNVIDLMVNDVSIGELGQMAYCAALFGVVPIFAAGDIALTREAEELLPGIQTVSVKEGLNQGPSDHLDQSEYARAFAGARHRPRQRVLAELEEGSRHAAERYHSHPGTFHRWTPPDHFHRTVRLRRHEGRADVLLEADFPDLLSLMNDLVPFASQPVERNQA